MTRTTTLLVLILLALAGTLFHVHRLESDVAALRAELAQSRATERGGGR